MYITKPLNKKNFDTIIYNSFLKEGIKKASLIVDILKSVGFYFGTLGGYSIGMNDLNTPEFKKNLILELEKLILIYDKYLKLGYISQDVLENTILTKWTSITQKVKILLGTYFKEKDPYNDIYVMATSGARGNTNQMNQLLGLRGLMSDAEGNTIKTPILTNFKEGLLALDYFISAFGARKGIVDTALKTADSGYLTRRLVYLAQNIQIKTFDCKTKDILYVSINKDSINTIVGSICTYIPNIKLKEPILITPKFLQYLKAHKITKIGIRNPKLCSIKNGICQLCYGLNSSTQNIVDLGEAVGVSAAQSIGEPGTQLTMRTFHTGGVSSQSDNDQNTYYLTNSGIYKKSKKRIQYLFGEDGKSILQKKVIGSKHFFIKNKIIKLERIKEKFTDFDILPLYAKQKSIVLYYKKRNRIVKLYLKSVCEKKYAIISEFLNLKKKQKKRLSSIKNKLFYEKEFITGNIAYVYPLSFYKLKRKNIFLIKNNLIVNKGYPFVCLPVQKKQTNDIVQGLPKVESILEIRNQDNIYKKNILNFSFFEYTEFLNLKKNNIYNLSNLIFYLNSIFKNKKIKEEELYKIISILIKRKNFIINYNKLINYINLILKSLISFSIQKIYFSQGVSLYIKHIDIIVNEMLSKSIIIHSGDTLLYFNEIINNKLLNLLLNILNKYNKQYPIYIPEIFSLTKTGLQKPGFLANAGFQETKKIITKAAIFNKKDWYITMKDSLILGKKLPLSTTLKQKQNQLDFVYFYKNKI